MKADLRLEPRVFASGGVTIRDHGSVELDPGDMVTYRSKTGKSCDVTAFEWGFYLASSLNGRLRREGFRTALVANTQGKLFLNAVEDDKISLFERYLADQGSRLVLWLDEYDCG